MIIKYQDFLNEKSLAPEGIVYADAVKLFEMDQHIRKYIIAKYIGMFSLPKISLDSKSGVEKLLRFAKKHKDNQLINLIQEYLEEIEKMKIQVDTRKYNL